MVMIVKLFENYLVSFSFDKQCRDFSTRTINFIILISLKVSSLFQCIFEQGEGYSNAKPVPIGRHVTHTNIYE